CQHPFANSTADCTMFSSPHPDATATNSPSLHDALPIWRLTYGQHFRVGQSGDSAVKGDTISLSWIEGHYFAAGEIVTLYPRQRKDRKRTRLNYSHVKTSYAVFCL